MVFSEVSSKLLSNIELWVYRDCCAMSGNNATGNTHQASGGMQASGKIGQWPIKKPGLKVRPGFLEKIQSGLLFLNASYHGLQAVGNVQVIIFQ